MANGRRNGNRMTGVAAAGLALATLGTATAWGLDSNRNLFGNRVDTAKMFLRFDRMPTEADRARLEAIPGVNVKYVYQVTPAIAVHVPSDRVAEALALPGVTGSEPILTARILDQELDDAWGVKLIGGGVNHDRYNTGMGIIVAVIDTGIDYNHLDLDDNYLGGYNFRGNRPDPFDDNGHGTHVSGTVAAEDNGGGVVGMAPDAGLVALKCFGSLGFGDWDDIAAAVEWCALNGVHVTNNSYGGASDPGQTLRDAYQAAFDAGVIMVVAAGNSGNAQGTGDNVSYPAKWDDLCYAIAATNINDQRASFSSTGPSVDFAAPGENVYSTLPGNSFGPLSGTSMATPHVCGTVANLLSAGYSGFDEIYALLRDTSTDLGTTGFDHLYGHGRINADLAAEPMMSLSSSALVRGQAASMTAMGAGAGETVYFVYSQSTGYTPVGALGTALGLGAPTLGGQATADGSGTAVLNTTIPGGAPAVPIFLQAAASGGTSNVVLEVIQ